MARLPRTMTQAPLRTVRPKDLANVYTNPRVQLARLIELGAAKRLAHGYAMAIPDDQDGAWKPTVEAAAAGIAAAIFGQSEIVLMGITAARIHQAIPRAIGNAVIAVPRQHRPIRLEDGGEVLFVARDTARLDARLERLEVGQALVTTPEQTMLDLAKRPGLGGIPDEALTAMVNLAPQVDFEKVERLAKRQRALAALERIQAIR